MSRKTERFIKADKKDLEHEWLIEQFMDYLRAEGKSKKTMKNYRSDLYIWFSWFEQNCKLKGKPKTFDQLKTVDIIKFQGELLEKGMSVNRYSRLKSVISSLANYCENILAEDDDYPEYKNFKSVVNKVKKPPKEAVREKTILTNEECQRYLDKLVETERYQMACAFALAWASGRRKAELLEIKCSHINDKNLKWGSLYKTDKIKCKGKLQEVYILKSKFKPYFDLWMEERERLGVPKEIDDIFVKREHGQWRKSKESQLNYYADVFSKEMGVNFYFHCLRHQFTTTLLESGIPESVVQQIIGWSSADMIAIYDDRDKDDLIGEYFKNGEITSKQKNDLSNL